MASVSFADVSKTFLDGVAAVDRLDLEIADREFLVLLGPSGCGKSTTLRLVAGLEACTAGEIRIGGHVVNRVPPKDRDIAMVFQNYALYPHMSVYRNLAFGLTLRYGGGWLTRAWLRLIRPAEARSLAEKRKGIRRQVQETAKALRIEHLLDRMPRQLSGGERQRVALGRAMVRQPAVFLFDEPLSNLDAKLRLETRRELKRLHQRLQTTMIYVTHDQTEALTLGQRIAVMQAGRLQQLGTPAEIYDQPNNLFVAGFVGSPPMNLVSGTLRRRGEEVEFRHQHVTVSLPAARMRDIGRIASTAEPGTLGIRPEDTSVRLVRGERADGQEGADGQVESGGPVADGERREMAVRGCVTMVESVGDSAYVHVATGLHATDGASPVSGGERDVPQAATDVGGAPAAAAGSVPGSTLVCKTDPRTTIAPGALVDVALGGSRIHLFDGKTEESLTL